MIKMMDHNKFAIDMKDDYCLDGFIKSLLRNGYTISQNESSKDGFVKLYVFENKFAKTIDEDVFGEEMC